MSRNRPTRPTQQADQNGSVEEVVSMLEMIQQQLDKTLAYHATTVEREVASLQGSSETLHTDLAELQTNISSVQQNVAGLQANTASLNGQMMTLQDSVQSLTEAVAADQDQQHVAVAPAQFDLHRPIEIIGKAVLELHNAQRSTVELFASMRDQLEMTSKVHLQEVQAMRLQLTELRSEMAHQRSGSNEAASDPQVVDTLGPDATIDLTVAEKQRA